MTAPINCDIKSISSLTPTVYRVVLEPQTSFTFKAGQYLFVHMSEEDKRPFSIGSSTSESGTVELHIGAEESNKFAYEVLQKMQSEKSITVSGGFGDAHYQPNSSLPAILIAGGTGFSYTYSILKEALAQKATTPISLYWGGRKTEDLYLMDELTKLAVEHPHFSFYPVVEFPEDNWQGKTGWVHQAVLSDYPSLDQNQVYIAGRFEMAKTARDDFFAQGLTANALFGDAYAFI